MKTAHILFVATLVAGAQSCVTAPKPIAPHLEKEYSASTKHLSARLFEPGSWTTGFWGAWGWAESFSLDLYCIAAEKHGLYYLGLLITSCFGDSHMGDAQWSAPYAFCDDKNRYINSVILEHDDWKNREAMIILTREDLSLMRSLSLVSDGRTLVCFDLDLDAATMLPLLEEIDRIIQGCSPGELPQRSWLGRSDTP